MIEYILGGVYGIGIAAMYFAVADLAKDNELQVTIWDRAKLTFISLFWPYMILYLAFYMLTDYVRVR